MRTRELRRKLARLETERDMLHERLGAARATLAALAAEEAPEPDRAPTRKHLDNLRQRLEEAEAGIGHVERTLAESEVRDRDRQLSEAREAASAALSRRDQAAEAVDEHYRKVAADHAPLRDDLAEAIAEALRAHREVLRLEGADNYTIFHAYPPASGTRIPSGSDRLAREGGGKSTRPDYLGAVLPQEQSNGMNVPESQRDPLNP